MKRLVSIIGLSLFLSVLGFSYEIRNMNGDVLYTYVNHIYVRMAPMKSSDPSSIPAWYEVKLNDGSRFVIYSNNFISDAPMDIPGIGGFYPDDWVKGKDETKDSRKEKKSKK